MRFSFASLAAFVAITAALAAATAAADPASPEPFFFRVSPIEATAQLASGATRYGVTVTNTPVGNAPFIRWYLDLKPGATNALCSNDTLPGGTRAGPGRYVWKNQGLSFVWYHGPKGSYAARRSYGCDQAQLGRNGYPGTVTVVFENDSETCTASFAGISMSERPQVGRPAVCQLGGYLPLPVPRALLRAHAAASAGLDTLLQRARTRMIGRTELANAIAAVLKSEADAFRLFPPVWGCRFDVLFQAVLDARTALGEQLAETPAGKQRPSAALQVSPSMNELEATLNGCEPTTVRPVGVPASVTRAVTHLAARARAVGTRGTTAKAQAEIRAIDVALDRLIATRFPSVLGIAYVDLVDRVMAENSAAAQADQAASSGDLVAATSALAQLRRYEGTTVSDLRKQAARSAKAEKAA
jgi:hypothetical protein